MQRKQKPKAKQSAKKINQPKPVNKLKSTLAHILHICVSGDIN